jgi:hypothetical protein
VCCWLAGVGANEKHGRQFVHLCGSRPTAGRQAVMGCAAP